MLQRSRSEAPMETLVLFLCLIFLTYNHKEHKDDK
jgi:hypothetical protein